MQESSEDNGSNSKGKPAGTSVTIKRSARDKAGRYVVHALLAVFATVLIYIVLSLVFDFQVNVAIFFGLSFALLFFTLGQSIYEIGPKRALAFLVATAVIGFLAEVLGTSSGFPFGKYYYTDFLGPKILGVPEVVPLVWFVIAYLSYSMANGAFSDSSKTRLTGWFKIAMFSAFGAVAWDFVVDPMFSAYHYWVWTGEFVPLPELDGIPLTNFIGWFALVTLMLLVCKPILGGVRKSGKSKSTARNSSDSRIAYLLLLVDGVVANYRLGNYAVIFVGAAAMLAFVSLSYHFEARNERRIQKEEQQGQVSSP